MLVDLTHREVGALRDANLASSQRRMSTQVVSVLLRQMGELLLSPMVDAVWQRVAEPGEEERPTLTIRVED